MKRPKIIGLTGGIGSGKSTAAAWFRAQGIPTLDADAISRAALDPGSDCYRKTVELFGPDCLQPDGTVNRAEVAKRIFADPKLREALNSLIHPFVLEEMQRETALLQTERVVWEVPLLFESGYYAYCDCTVSILCAESIRVDRICRRNGVTPDEALSRIRAQITDAEREALSDVAVRNEGTPEELFDALAKMLSSSENRL